MAAKKVNFSISATNDSSTSIDSGGKLSGGYRFSGQNIIKFVIPQQEALLETKTLNLDFQLITLNSSLNPVSDLNKIEENNGVDMSETTNINSNAWSGSQSIISKVMVQSLRSPVELSNQTNYVNYISVRDAHTYNDKDYLDVPYIKTGCSGVNSQYTNRHFNISPDAAVNNTGTMSNLSQGNINDSAFGQYCSMQIKNPVLNNKSNLHMGSQYLGGLVVTIYLESNSGYFSQRFSDAGSAQTYGTLSGVSYLVKNPRLRGKYIYPSLEQMKNYNNNLALNSRISLINDIQSSTNVSTYTPQITSAKAFVNLFYNQDTFNTFSKNQYDYRVPLGLTEYTELYNNQRNPRDYKIEVSPNQLTNTVQNGVGSIENSKIHPACALQGLSDVRLKFQKSLFDGKLAYHTSASTRLTDSVINESFKQRGTIENTEGVLNNQISDVMGIGSDYTGSLNFSQNFFNNSYALKVDSGVAAGIQNLPADSRDQFELIQTYIRNNEVLDMRSLIKSM